MTSMSAVPDFDLQPTLVSPEIVLRPLRADDFESLYAAASDPAVWEQHPEPDRWKRQVFGGFFRGALESGGAFAAVDPSAGRVVGSSRYYGLDAAKSEVVIGYSFLARAYWGGRWNRAMKKLMLDHAFRFVDAAVFHVGERNMRSRRAMEKIGGVLSGTLPAASRDGAPRVNVVYRIRRADYSAAGVSAAG